MVIADTRAVLRSGTTTSRVQITDLAVVECLSLTLLCAVVFVTDRPVCCVAECLSLTLLCAVVFVTDRPVWRSVCR